MIEQSDFIFKDERFADIQLLRYQIPGFQELTLRQKLLIYHLSRAALLGRDILWDQNGAYNLHIRQVLEAIYTQYQGDRTSDDFLQFTIYLKRVWFSNGIHHHYGYQKFIPAFSKQFFTDAAKEVGLDVNDLIPIIFDPSVLSKRVNQAEGEDLLLTSASNYYQEGITQAEAEAFYARQKEQGDKQHPVMYGMNSRLEKQPDGTLQENVWKSGGMYGPYINRIIAALNDAIPFAEALRSASPVSLESRPMAILKFFFPVFSVRIRIKAAAISHAALSVRFTFSPVSFSSAIPLISLPFCSSE